MSNAAPPAFHLMAKPTGAVCNLDCARCFFLSKEIMGTSAGRRANRDAARRVSARRGGSPGGDLQQP